MASFCDIAVPLLGALISALLVLRWGWVGAAAGFIVFWGFCYLRLELLYHFDPQREGGVLDAAVISIISPALGLLWCLLCLLARFLYRRAFTHRVRRA